MYAILGDYKFQGYKGFQELTSSDETVLAEHPVIDGKPRLQSVGEKLRDIQLKFVLHSSFSDPEADLLILQNYRRNANIIPFVSGDGTTFGNFVIKSITTNYEQTDNSGRIISAAIEINLLEAVTPDAGKIVPKERKLATEIPKLNIAALPARPTDPQLIASNLKIINTNSAAMDRELNEADKIPSKTSDAFRSAKNRIAKIKKSIVAIEKVGTTTRNIIGMYDSITGQVQSVKGATESLSLFVEAGDLASSINGSAQLRNSVDSLYVDAAPINNLVGQRKESEPPVSSGTEFDFPLNGTFF
jgi:phage protein U